MAKVIDLGAATFIVSEDHKEVDIVAMKGFAAYGVPVELLRELLRRLDYPTIAEGVS